MGGEEQEIDVGAAVARLREGQIVEFRYKQGAFVDLDAAKAIVAAGLQLVGDDDPKPTLVVLCDLKAPSREARMYFGQSEENQRVSSHVAMLVTSPIARMIGNFMMGLNKPVIPTRLFTDQEAALQWLSEYSAS